MIYKDHILKYPSLAMDEIASILQSNKCQSHETIDLGKGISCFNPFEIVDLQLSKEKLECATGYGEISGFLPLKILICEFYQKNYHVKINPDQVCITDGASGALLLALSMLVCSGGEILIAESHYPIYRILAKILGVTCKLLPLQENFCVDTEKIFEHISDKTQAILINSPVNPHGTFLRADELKLLSHLDTPIILDEVYQSLPLINILIPSGIQFSDQIYIVNSFSKSFAIAGFRVGYLIVPQHQVQLMLNVKAVINMCTSLPSQILAYSLMQGWDQIIAKHQTMLRNNWEIFQTTSRQLNLKVKLQPEAGFFGLIDLEDIGLDSEHVAKQLAYHYALGTAPGIDFFTKHPNFLRLNFACPSDKIIIGLNRIANYLHQC
jgi:aspartate/methionine/tyrosine aminotransferase